MRRPFVAGNWKMNLGLDPARALARSVARGSRELADRVDLGVFPPYPYLLAVQDEIADSRVVLGGQDLHWESEGAFTGAVSGPMLRAVGATWTLVGHSERRHVFGETDLDTNRKVHAAMNHDLSVILCVGEKIEERESARTEAVLERQTRAALEGTSQRDLARVALAYEPVWAIGTGKTATPDIAQAAHAFLRRWIEGKYGAGPASELRILYGGSVKAGNAAALMGQPDIDGFLVGGASLAADSFLAIASVVLPQTPVIDPRVDHWSNVPPV